MSHGPPQVFDRRTYRLRRERAEAKTGDLFLVEEAARHLADRLGAINRRFARGLDLESRAAAFGLLAPHAEAWTRTGFAPAQGDIVGDEEMLPFAAESFDLVTSVLSLHAVNDLPGSLLQIRQIPVNIAARFTTSSTTKIAMIFGTVITQLGTAVESMISLNLRSRSRHTSSPP